MIARRMEDAASLSQMGRITERHLILSTKKSAVSFLSSFGFPHKRYKSVTMGSSTTTASAAAASSGSGRERAIEALLDNDPQGCFHRLTKIMVGKRNINDERIFC